MGDMADAFTALRESTREKRARQLAGFEPGPEWTKHTVHHYSMTLGGRRLDFWPSTRRWRYKGRCYRGNLKALLGFIRKRENG